MKKCEKTSVDAKHGIEFKKQFDFVFNLIGLMVGFGNVWRFPYMCYKNGGGSFLVAYATFIVIFIFPLIIIESAIGQYTGHSAVRVWTMMPLFRGIGYVSPLLMFYINIYYPVLLTWAARWLVASFSRSTPWMKCDNSWNTKQCLPLSIYFQNEGNASELSRAERNSILNATGYRPSVEEFWSRHLLNSTDGIEDIGEVKPDLLACLAVVWILAYFSIWKGIQWTSKIVYVTAILPIVMVLVVMIRGVTLEGSSAGLEVYLRPNMTKLGEVELWTDAATQVLFSLGVCAGGITTLSKFNKFNHNFFRDSILLVVANAVVSFLSGLATFSILGFLAKVKNTTVDDVAESGPGLVFIAYPTALSLLPLPQFWCAVFFIMLLLLGFDSLFVYQETFVSCLKDQFPQCFRFKWASEIITAAASLVMFLLGISIVTRGGMYVLNIFNTYSVAGWCIYFISFWELIAAGWVYDADRLLDDAKTMLGFGLSRMYYKICWKFVGPATAAILMVYTLANYHPLKYGKSYSYPLWADGLGWATALSTVLTVPLTAAYVLYRAEGCNLTQKFKNSLRIPGSSKRAKKNERDGLELQILRDSQEKT